MTTVTDAVLSAAKDRGDSTGDKTRKSTLAGLARQAGALQALLPKDSSDDVYPEVAEALGAAAELMSLSMKLDQQSDALKRAPGSSREAEDAQAALDQSRKNIDSMLPAVVATMSTLETLVDATLEMEIMYRKSLDEIRLVKEKLSNEKSRLVSVARAVSHATKLG